MNYLNKYSLAMFEIGKIQIDSEQTIPGTIEQSKKPKQERDIK